MIDQISTKCILQSIGLILDIMNKAQNHPPRVISESMNLIRDCTREIKSAEKSEKNLFLECLKFVLKYIEDEKICNYAAFCFQILMETVNKVDDEMLVAGLLEYYQNQRKNKKQFLLNNLSNENLSTTEKDIIVEKVLEGVFNSIVKFENRKKVPEYLQKLMAIIVDYYIFKEDLYQKLQNTNIENKKQIEVKNNKTALFYDCLLEIKTLLCSYEAQEIDTEFRKISNGMFRRLCLHSLTIIQTILSKSLTFE